MNDQEIQAIVAKILNKLEKQPQEWNLDIKTNGIPVESSARHVHLTAQAVEALFGKGEVLIKKRDLSQTGEFLSQQRVRLVTPKGEISNVAVLGPIRNETQVELSITDTKFLGIKAPVNLSGNLAGAGDVYLVGEKGMIAAPGSVIIARAHIHMTPQDALNFGVSDGQVVRVQVKGQRSVTFDEVVVRIKENFVKAMHIDYDEANSCGIGPDAIGVIQNGSGAAQQKSTECKAPRSLTKGVITEIIAKDMVKTCDGEVLLNKGTIITPSARDVFLHANCNVRYV